MRLPSDGGETSTSKGPIYDVCLGMYKHELFAPTKAKGLGCPPVKQNKNKDNRVKFEDKYCLMACPKV